MKIAKDLRIIKGTLAEFLGCIYLTLCGYKVLKWNFKSKSTAQIDIIAIKGDVLHLVEVKYRKNMADSIEAITYLQQQRLKNSVTYFVKKYKKPVVIDSLCFSLNKPFVKHNKNIF